MTDTNRMPNATTPEPISDTGGKVALLYCTDLMFAVQLQNMARHAGLRTVTVRHGALLPHAALLVVDLQARGDWEAAIREAAGRGMPAIAFGPHMDMEGRRKAKAAGAARVLANSNLERDLPLILRAVSESASETATESLSKPDASSGRTSEGEE